MGKTNLKGKRPIIIAGPCSAETHEQTLATCRALAETGMVDMYRAGIWKPRTHPGSFEGVGEQGLAWMQEAEEETGVSYGVEVANATHVKAALSHGADMVWIGARTTVNPFNVQEIAEALRDSGITVLVKNPLNPDVGMWKGAVERLIAAGIDRSDIGLVHRGFSQMGYEGFRNPPMWHIALEMRSCFPGMPMLCDPSHICGNTERIGEVAQRAADLLYDGLIIESHIAPETALSDASQQLTPAELVEMLDNIKWRSPGTPNPEFSALLEKCRGEIDGIDSDLFSLLSRRMKIAEEIGRIKKENDVTILQGERWNEIVEKIVSRSADLNLSPEFLRVVLDAIHIESIAHQNKVMN